MIELNMVGRMARRAALTSPVVIVGLGLWGGPRWALSAAIGVAMTLGNLWLAARIIGTAAQHSPTLLLGAAMISFGLGLATLTVLALGLRALDVVHLPVTGFVLIGSHLLLVLWEASGAYRYVGRVDTQLDTGTAARVRS